MKKQDTEIKKENVKDNYNYGVDILKIIATFMIIGMHILGQGGLIGGTTVGSANYYIVWIIEAICFGAVNLYGLSTGYLCVKKDVKTSGLIKRWLQVFFYTVFFTALFAILMPGVVSLKSWIKAIIPVTANQYWYFTQYFMLFFAIPGLNKMLKNMDQKSIKKLILAILLVLCLIPSIRQFDLFLTGFGYSGLWLIAMYIIGGYFSLYKDEIYYSKKGLWITLIVCNVLTIASKYIVDIILHVEINDFSQLALISYTSVTVVIASIAILLLCTNLKIEKGKKPIKFLGKLTFGVYLFHVNAFIWNHILKELFLPLSTWNPVLMILGIVGGALAIFAVAAIFEYLRIKFFEVARLNKLGDWCGNKIDYVLDNYILKRL